MNSVIKGASYILAHVPDMVIHNGTTQTTERIVNPSSEYLVKLPTHIRTYKEAVGYKPNQTYIGNMTPEELAGSEQPWTNSLLDDAPRYGKFGEIMPQDEFLLLMQVCDVFGLLFLSKDFVADVKPRFVEHPLVTEEMRNMIRDGVEEEEIRKFVDDEHAEPLYHLGKLVGYVKRAHDVDVNLSAHVIHENLCSKASCVLSVLHLVQQCGIDKSEIDYVIDCAEEACGDMNQRGGGNMAKAAAEMAGLTGASGCDIRAFCAAPAHSLIQAASLVNAGTYKNVVVAAGGCTAKLGMNGKDHVKNGLPIMEDVLGGFAVLVSKNDGINPEIDTNIVGKHSVGTGSSPQAVITALVAEPLDKAGMKFTDIDRYAPELHNPDITKPAGAGDVPAANYKMIAALAVKRGDLDKGQLGEFVKEHGMVGWAPTQGHIPSGLPYVGFACQDILAGKISKAMLIGKGSLFLGRMTNLFDGVSFVIKKNEGLDSTGQISEAAVKKMIGQAMRDFANSLVKE